MGTAGFPASSGHRMFTDLPFLIQQCIFAECSRRDLVSLALVSRRFHDLVSPSLYRNFVVVLPNIDEDACNIPTDDLAGGLETFATSEYDHAKHLRVLSLDTLSAGKSAEKACQPYALNSSCGKFMSSLLLLVLRKAIRLETFEWNVRIELSRQVLEQLRRLTSLQNLRLRMPAGASYHRAPSAIPPTLPNHGSDDDRRAKRGIEQQSRCGRSVFNGLRHLRSLSVFDIDDLEIVTELSHSVKQSPGLTELRLSFSESLASATRKPRIYQATDHLGDTGAIEDNSLAGLDREAAYIGQKNVLRIKEARRVQETALARILDVEMPPSELQQTELDKKQSDLPAANCKVPTGRELELCDEFVNSLRDTSNKMITQLNGAADVPAVQQSLLDVVEAAARRYVDAKRRSYQMGELSSADTGTKLRKPASDYKNNDSSSPRLPGLEDTSNTQTNADTSPETKPSSSVPCQADHMDDDKMNTLVSISDAAKTDFGATEPLRTSAAWTEGKLKECQALYDALMETFRSLDTQVATKLGNIDHLPSDGSHEELSKYADALRQIKSKVQLLDEFFEEVYNPGRNASEVASRSHVEREIPPKTMQDDMHRYVRDTRGRSLDTLAIHLIPVPAYVLSQALNLRSLRQLTLLNVGDQEPIWSMLSEQLDHGPLSLRSVHTDHVSAPFLVCLSQLGELHDLLLLQRDSAYRPRPLAPQTSVTMDQIRRLALKKHMSTLRRLLIEDQSESLDLVASEKTMSLICGRGGQLRELGVTMSEAAIQTLFQSFTGLAKLEALRFITGRWRGDRILTQKKLHGTVDVLYRHPNLPLKYCIPGDGEVYRIDIHIQRDVLKENTFQRVDNGGQRNSMQQRAYSSAEAGDSSGDENKDDDTNESYARTTQLQITTTGPLSYQSCYRSGVKILEKEILDGCL